MKGRWDRWAVRAFSGGSVGNVIPWSLSIGAHVLLGSACVPPGESLPHFENPSSTPWLAGMASLPWLAPEQLILCKERWTLSTAFVTPCLICSPHNNAESCSEQELVFTAIPPCCVGLGIFLFGHPHTGLSLHLPSILSPFSPRPHLLITSLFLPPFPFSLSASSSLSLPLSLLSFSLSLSSVSFSPPVIFLLAIVITKLSLGCYLYKTITKGARVTFLYGPRSKPLTDAAGIRENKLLMFYWNFTEGTR